jgi:phage-related minor tail protein
MGSLTVVAGGLGISISAIAMPVLIVIGVIALLIAIGVLLWKNWDTIMEWANKLWTTVKDAFNKMYGAVKESMGKMKDNVFEIWDNVMQFFKNIDLRQIGKDIIQGLINGITDMAGKVVESAKGIATSISDGIKGV